MFGYCTNVHAGPDLAQTQHNLQTHAESVKRICSPHGTMGVGLWLAAPAAERLCEDAEALTAFREYLQSAGLAPFTMNGFPYGDFHQEVVKHDVYHPTWAEPARLEYTKQLVQIQHQLLPEGMSGSISTLPIGWGSLRDDDAALSQAARQLADLASVLAELREDSGRSICVCIEPEPGCVMDRAEHITSFFEQYLLPAGDERPIRQHIQVCHDICHSAVMFEPQGHALRVYREAGIRIGKVQVSSAVALPLEALPTDERAAALTQLAAFNEPRYLHQTSHRDGDGQLHFFEDLGPALAWLEDPARQSGEVRVHFHVPIYLEQFGALHTTQRQVLACLDEVETDHFEVETYAWSVLPPELQQPSLADGIAAEMRWFQERI